jgi:hypothetical protein
MTNRNSDKSLDRLLRRALVPKGLRPRTDDQIARMLDTIGGAPVDQDKLARMLRKINGEEPVGPAPRKVLPYSQSPLTAAEEGLIALHRSQGTALPPEVEKKLRELERQAAQPPEDGEKDDDGQ